MLVLVIIVGIISFILSLTIVVTSTIGFGTKFVMQTKVDFNNIFKISLLYSILFGIGVFLLSLLTSAILEDSFINIIVAIVFNTLSPLTLLKRVWMPFLIIFIVTFLLQTLTILLVNVDFKKIWHKIVKKDKKEEKLLSQEQVTDETIRLPVIVQLSKLSFGKAAIISIYTFATLLFSSSLLLMIGTIIGKVLKLG